MLRKRSTAFISALCVMLIIQGASLPTHALAAGDAVIKIPVYTHAVKLGCNGEDVKALQMKLTELGFFNGMADGFFSTDTEAAVKAFQKANGIKEDGIASLKTFKAVFTAGSSGVTVYSLGRMDNQITLRMWKSGDNVRDLQTALTVKGFYKGPINGMFQAGTKSAVMAFQHRSGLKSDGKAGNYTLSALYTMLNPPDLESIKPWPAGIESCFLIPVKALEWSYVGQKVFTRGMDAVIVDVRSGYIFNGRRTGGSHHADVETLTPADTAAFFKCSGNFSWSRRPVWVLVGGQRLAASMNCMPHGYDTLPDNDFRGQFCIHFLGSRTHDMNKVDPEHQACIEESFQAGLWMQQPPASAVISPDPSALVWASPVPTATAPTTSSPTTSVQATPDASFNFFTIAPE